MTHENRRIEDQLPGKPLQWAIPEAEKEGYDVDTSADLYDCLLGVARKMGYRSVMDALQSCSPNVAEIKPQAAPAILEGHWLPKRDPADEGLMLSRITRQYPQLESLMGREMLLMRCVREALAVSVSGSDLSALPLYHVNGVGDCVKLADVQSLLAGALPVSN